MGDTVETCNEFQQVELSISIASAFTVAGTVWLVMMMTKHGLGKYATKLAERVERRLRRDRIQALIDKALEEVPIVPKRVKKKPTKYKKCAKFAFGLAVFLSVIPFLLLELVRMLFDAFLLMNNWSTL